MKTKARGVNGGHNTGQMIGVVVDVVNCGHVITGSTRRITPDYLRQILPTPLSSDTVCGVSRPATRDRHARHVRRQRPGGKGSDGSDGGLVGSSFGESGSGSGGLYRYSSTIC